jgi:DNA-binding response OmpR family regulator
MNESGAASSGRNDAPTVLIVEDDALVAEMYRLALVRGGYRVVTAPDGEAGLQVARSTSPDFIFLDIRMPKMNGMELLGHLASDATTQEIPVVMLTNFDDSAQVSASKRLGAKEYIVKTSIAPGDLPEIVSRWLFAA